MRVTPVMYSLDTEDRELLQKFQIHKNIKIKLIKLQLKPKTAQKVPLIFSSSVFESGKEFGGTDDADCAKIQQKRFKCSLCPFSSAFKCNLKKHLWIHSAHKQFKCDKCSHGTNSKRDLKMHAILKHNKNPQGRIRNYPCQLCIKWFFTMSALRSHLSVHTKEKPFSCQFCSKELQKNTSKIRHEIICNQNLKRKDPVWIESQKRFQCKLCSKKMLTRGELTIHIRRHTQERPYKCDQCDYAGALAMDLKSHVERRHNSNKIKTFDCKMCHKLFFTKKELYSHIKTHTKEKSSACWFCKRLFGQAGTRNRHQAICKSNPKQSDAEWVNKHKRFKCELCKFASTDSSRLKKHLRIHAGTNNIC